MPEAPRIVRLQLNLGKPREGVYTLKEASSRVERFQQNIAIFREGLASAAMVGGVINLNTGTVITGLPQAQHGQFLMYQQAGVEFARELHELIDGRPEEERKGYAEAVKEIDDHKRDNFYVITPDILTKTYYGARTRKVHYARVIVNGTRKTSDGTFFMRQPYEIYDMGIVVRNVLEKIRDNSGVPQSIVVGSLNKSPFQEFEPTLLQYQDNNIQRVADEIISAIWPEPPDPNAETGA